MTVRNTSIDHEGVKRLEAKINEIDKEVKSIGKVMVSIDEQLKSANQLRDLQIQHLQDDNAEQWKTIEKHDTRLDNLDAFSLPTRVGKLEEHLKWLIYMIIGAIVTAVLSQVIK